MARSGAAVAQFAEVTPNSSSTTASRSRQIGLVADRVGEILLGVGAPQVEVYRFG
jgi:hypothetical protein